MGVNWICVISLCYGWQPILSVLNTSNEVCEMHSSLRFVITYTEHFLHFTSDIKSLHADIKSTIQWELAVLDFADHQNFWGNDHQTA